MMSDLSDYGLRHRTEVLHARLNAELRQHVLEISNEDQSMLDMLRWARQNMILAQRFKIMTVVLARVVHGWSWAEIGAEYHLNENDAKKIYGDAEKRWLGGDPEPWAPRIAAVVPMFRRLLGGA